MNKSAKSPAKLWDQANNEIEGKPIFSMVTASSVRYRVGG